MPRERPDLKKLYMYRPANVHTLDIVRKSAIWLSRTCNFNDPFDGSLDLSHNPSASDMLASIINLYGPIQSWSPPFVTHIEQSFTDLTGQCDFTPKGIERRNRLVDRYYDVIGRVGIACFTEVCDSILMWSHYAKNHTGVCLEFDRKWNNPLGDTKCCRPVEYVDTYPEIDLGKVIRLEEGTFWNEMLIYKADCWSYEKEWRLGMTVGDRLADLPGPISKVIFGLKTDANYQLEMQELCSRKAIRTVKAERAPKEFRIVIPR